MKKKGGIFYFTILDFYSAGISVFYIAFCEVIAVVWIYGANRLAKNISLLNNEKPNKFFVGCWYAVTPVLILVIWTFNWIKYEPIKYGKMEYPASFQVFGWSIALISIMAIPLGAIHQLYKSSGRGFYEVILLFMFLLYYIF